MDVCKGNVEKLRDILDSNRHFYFYDSENYHEDIWTPMNTFAKFEVYDNLNDLLEAHPMLMKKMLIHLTQVEKRPVTPVTTSEAICYTLSSEQNYNLWEEQLLGEIIPSEYFIGENERSAYNRIYEPVILGISSTNQMDMAKYHTLYVSEVHMEANLLVFIKYVVGKYRQATMNQYPLKGVIHYIGPSEEYDGEWDEYVEKFLKSNKEAI